MNQPFSSREMLLRTCFGLLAMANLLVPSHAAEVNLLINSNFCHTYPARRLLEPTLPYVRGIHKLLPSFEGETFMPYGWAMAPDQDGQGVVSIADDRAKKTLRLQTKERESLILTQRYIEVVPGATYTCGLSAKGQGRVTVTVSDAEPAPWEQLASFVVEAKPEWQTATAVVKPGPHRHLATYQVQIAGKTDVLLREAEFTATAPEGQAMKDVLITKLTKDADTLFYEDFDGDSVGITLNEVTKLAAAEGGRFGRGLVTSSERGGSATRMTFGDIPEKGTVEFWFKPDSFPKSEAGGDPELLGLATQTPGMTDTRLTFVLSHWLASFKYGFQHPQWNSKQKVYANVGAGWGWWQPGTWHHFAGSWDGEALRFYLDGVMEGICFNKEILFPKGKALDLVLPYPGVIDEIRISKVLRYGPVVPEGAKWVAYSPPAATETKPTVEVAKEPTEEDLDKERAKLLAPGTEASADYLFGVSQMKPAWEGMPGVQVKKDYFGQGVEGLSITPGSEVGRAVYCRLENITPGKYYSGLWTESNDVRWRTEYAPWRLNVSAYLNGWPLRFSTTSEPIQVQPGRWLVELQSAKSVALKDGDEIAFCPVGYAQTQTFLRLALYRKEPKRGHGVTGQTFGVDNFTPQRLRLVLQPEIAGTGEDGTQHEARITIANPLPYATEVEVAWRLADYYGAPVMQKTERLRIEPHKDTILTNAFTAVGDARAYQLDVRTRPVPGAGSGDPRPTKVPRPLEWLELNDYTKIEFLPNQPGPLNVWKHTRKDLVSDRSGDRKLMSLNGSDWEWAYLDGRRVPDAVPADLKFGKCSIPIVETWIQLPSDRFGKWFRKRFQLPEWMTGGNYTVEIRQATSEATVFMNGQRVGSGLGQSLPLTFNVTKALKPGGENELLVCVRDPIALMNPDYVDKYDPSDPATAQSNQAVFGRVDGRHVANLESVFLHTAPQVRVRQGLVIADVDNQKLRIMTRVENLDARPRQVALRFQVFQNGKPVAASIPEQTMSLDAGSVKEVVVEGPAGNLIPYTPQNPVLARLTTLVTEGGETLDSFDQRFGYRTLRVKGTGMTLNGKPVNLRGAFQHWSHNTYEGEDCIRVSRDLYENPDPYQTLDLYDEIGVFHYVWVGLAWCQDWKKLNNKPFWESFRQHAVENVWDKGSHACVVGWDISNESYHYAPYSTGKEGQDKHGEVISSAAQAIREKTWPGYWCLADGDENLGGRLDFCSFHYLNHGYAPYGFAALPDKLGYFDGVSHFPPDCFYLNLASEVPKKGTKLAMRPDWEYSSTACGDTETFWFYGMSNGVGAAKYLGDRATVSTGWQFGTGRGMGWTKMALDGYRDMEQSFIGGMYWKSVLGVFSQDVTFDLPEQAIRYYSGKRFDRRLNLHDDEFQPGNLKFRWQLLDPTGKAVRQGQIVAQSDTAFLKRDRIAFDLPVVSRRTRFTLDMELWKDGTKRAHEERLLEVWPEAASRVTLKGTVGVFDLSNQVAPILTKLGCTVKQLFTLDAASLSGLGYLIVGPDCVTKDMAGQREAMCGFVRNGGRVLVLHQNDASLMPFDVTIEKRGWFSIGFVRLKDHPVMKGLEDVDFAMWNPDHLIAKGVYRKPDKGNVLTLLDSGHDGTMAWSEVLEIYLGKGSVIAVQLPLVERFNAEPMCAELLRRLLNYMGQPTYRNPSQRLAILGSASEPVLKRLKDVRADCEVVASVAQASSLQPDKAVALPPDGRSASCLLVDLNTSAQLPEAAPLRTYAENGVTLLLHRARPEHQAWLEAVTGRKVSVQVQPYQSWTDRQMLERRDGLLAGVNNLDLYWRSLITHEDVSATCQVSNGVEKGKERGQVLYVANVEGASDDLFPGGLLEVPVGKGKVILDQLKWETSEKDMVCGSPTRVLSTLLTNLGVVQKLPTPKPSLPKGVTYEPIDLSSVANRSFKDEKAGDGVGWLDWGPDADLSSFPTGKVTLAGVPYLIPTGEKNAVVLKVDGSMVPSLSDYPKTVTIPVNKARVAALMSLHTGGWAYGMEPFLLREVEYADGTKEVMRLNGTNAADWNPGHDDFPDEEGTLTTVAWKGANNQYPTIRVYQTLWLNPHAEKEIKQVVLTNADLPAKQHRFVPHLGLTAAILSAAPAGAPPTPAAGQRDSDKSRALLQEAMALLEAKKTAAAASKLDEALKADDRNVGAWFALTTLRADTDTLEAFTALCRRWMEAMPDNYQAHNVLGRFLEAKGKLAEALEEYRASLKIEWNQPMTGEAVRRVEKNHAK